MLYNRIIYLGYYIKELDKDRFKQFLQFVASETGRSKLSIMADAVASSLKYNTSILEYFMFHFYQLSAKERALFAGTGFMYEYQLKMNPKSSRTVLANKLEFLSYYRRFIKHDFASLTDLQSDNAVVSRILANKSGKVVLKSTTGQCGRGIEVRNSSDFTSKSLIERLFETENDLVEEFVIQHIDLMKLSPSGLNTLRVITQLGEDNKVNILGAMLRITINSSIDNLAAGNIAAPIDVDTGLVNGPAVYSDITKADEYEHPVTKAPIIGFKIPFWEESMKMVTEAALLNPNNRSIGWDIAITDQGPELIEGNHDWCKLLWQLPAKKGMKQELEKFL